MGIQNVKKLKYNIIPLLKHNTMNTIYVITFLHFFLHCLAIMIATMSTINKNTKNNGTCLITYQLVQWCHIHNQ